MKRLFLAFLIGLFVVQGAHAQTKNLLSEEEKLWLLQRNSTIVVYPEQNSPPFSYQSFGGSPQGLSIDYLDLIAEKIGARLQYLTARPRSQIIEDVQKGKGDVVALLTADQGKENFLFFTEPYITVPAVIVVRKDIDTRSGLTLNDFVGKRVAVIQDSALELYTHTNYPRVVIEGVTDDEVSLQQVVLGEVDAAIMDVASLSYYLSKQVLSSVKIVGSTGFEYRPSFAVPKDRQILQGILEKGLSQISTADRALLTDKWIALPDQQVQRSWWQRLQDNVGVVSLIVASVLGLGVIILAIVRTRHIPLRYFRKRRAVETLQDEVSELEYASKELVNELEGIKQMEAELKDKMNKLQ